ncbi:protease inhibitor I9 family protein [Archangium lipolyticum]|uniref:protease inhibitor I9 family protein n=1 Tax=Archangium lipolyticum TaxID=2970465 RepID=UPI00214A5F93|nr:protease inhibitor I9 family protein [Archangium lipolyticum]
MPTNSQSRTKSVTSALALLLGLVLTACGAESGDCLSPAPFHPTSGDKVPDSYLVIFEEDVPDSLALTQELESRHGFTATHRYKTAVKGFAATLPADTVSALRCEAGVAYVEEDSYVTVD